MYENRFNSEDGYPDRVWQVLAGEFFARWFTPDQTVLDLGAGYGGFINHIQAKKKHAMDLNPDAARYCSNEVVVLQQDCSETWPLPASSLDVVFTSNFFEHLPTKRDLERTLQQALRCLKPGGELIAMGPNARYTGGAYWDFFDHHLALTERSLVEVLKKAGFQIVEICPQFLPYTMTSRRQPPLLFLRLYLKLRLAWRLFGRQFLVIARKPAGLGPNGYAREH